MRTAVIMVPATVLALALSAVPACAEGAGAELPTLDFDQGINVSDVIKAVKEKAAENKDAQAVAAHAYYTRYDRDCVNFTIGAGDPPQTQSVWLRSTEWVEECYPQGPNGQQVCHQRPGFTWQERASVTLRDRQPLLPWEYDRFQVCLEGPWVGIYEREAAYDYKVVQGGNRDGDFVLAPVKKIAMSPDPTGILAQSLTPSLALTLKDKWASYYAGERTVLVLKLKKDVPNWFDPTLLEKELAFPAAEAYAVDFMAYVKEFSQGLEAGKKYYVDYSFKRVGKISKDKLMKVGETDRAAYQPAPQAVGR
ncbi:MAG: hypothetical protein HY927_02380 [Elusimicrobia bacterium]|nr:hypothetical protein [Elusimicrobiota bacterium]